MDNYSNGEAVKGAPRPFRCVSACEVCAGEASGLGDRDVYGFAGRETLNKDQLICWGNRQVRGYFKVDLILSNGAWGKAREERLACEAIDRDGDGSHRRE